MRRIMIPIFAGLAAMLLLSGCVLNLALGGGKKDASRTTTSSTSNSTSNSNTTNNDPHSGVNQQMIEPTLGQQLIDLKKAKDSGAITEAEYETEKVKLLNEKK